MESELDEDGLCLRGLPCHRVSPVGMCEIKSSISFIRATKLWTSSYKALLHSTLENEISRKIQKVWIFNWRNSLIVDRRKAELFILLRQPLWKFVGFGFDFPTSRRKANLFQGEAKFLKEYVPQTCLFFPQNSKLALVDCSGLFLDWAKCVPK